MNPRTKTALWMGAAVLALLLVILLSRNPRQPSPSSAPGSQTLNPTQGSTAVIASNVLPGVGKPGAPDPTVVTTNSTLVNQVRPPAVTGPPLSAPVNNQTNAAHSPSELEAWRAVPTAPGPESKPPPLPRDKTVLPEKTEGRSNQPSTP